MKTTLTARMRIVLNELPFVAEKDYDSLVELAKDATAMQQRLGSNAIIQFLAVLFYFETETGLDEESQDILGQVLARLGLGEERYFNEAAGSYDSYTNRVEAADFGLVFPDGTVRVAWHRDTSKHALRDSQLKVERAIAILIDAQTHALANPLGEDEEDDASAIYREQRIGLLADAGIAT